MKKKRILAAAAVGASLIGIGFATTTPASAATTDENQVVFIYQDFNFGSQLGFLNGFPDPNLGENLLNDTISSVQNFTSQAVCFFTDNNFTGNEFAVQPGQSIAQLPPQFNDQFSSERFC